MIRHPSTLTKIQLHCRSVAAAAVKPRALDAISYLDRKPRASVAGSSTHEPPLPEGSTSPRPLPTPKVWSRPQQPMQSSPTSLETPAASPLRKIRTAPPPEALKKWSRVAPARSNSSQMPILDPNSQPVSHAGHQKVSQPIDKHASLSPESNQSLDEQVRRPRQPMQSSPTSLETPAASPPRKIRTAPPPEALKKWSRVAPARSNSSQMPILDPNSQPASHAGHQKVSQPVNKHTSLSPQSNQSLKEPIRRPQQPMQSSPTSLETPAAGPLRKIRTAPPPEALKKWSRIAPARSNSSQMPILDPNSQPASHAGHRKVSQPMNKHASLSPESNQSLDEQVRHPQQPMQSSPTSLETPAAGPLRKIRTAPPPEALKKWSRVAPARSNSSQMPILDSNSQPASHAGHQKVSQPVNKHTLLSPESNQSLEEPIRRPQQPMQSSPIMAEPPAASPLKEIRTAPSPEAPKKWSRPVTTNSSQMPVLDTNSQPAPPAGHQKVSRPINQHTSLSPDSNQSLEEPIRRFQQPMQSSSTSVETRAASPQIRTAPPEAVKKWSRPVAPRSNLSQMPVLDSNSHPAPPAGHHKVSRPINQHTSLSPDSNQSLEEPVRLESPEIPLSHNFNSLDTDPDEFPDKLLRPQRTNAQRRGNQKSYFESRGRFERVSSKVLLQQSANNPLSKKKARPVPKLIKARPIDLFIPSTLSVAALAKLLNVKLARLQQQMRRAGMESESSYDYILTSDYAVLLAEEFGRNPIVNEEAAFDIHPPVTHPNLSSLPSRPPIVTIMGHVDHGKTTLLDTLRSASVAKGEAGGITQHIGAFSVPVSKNETGSGPQSITFLDTPGHAAFSAMRARGANVTDIIVLVVAADDGIMPQTKEVINLFKRDDSQVNLVIAINKIDKPNVDVDSVKKALMVEGIQVEDFGGDIPAVHVSGLTGEGLPELLETLSLIAEMQDLRAEHTGPVYGHVLESNVQKGLGPVATILIRRGCLKVGTHILSGLSQAKVRRMNDSNGKIVPVALPGMAVTVSGWKILPKVGDEVLDGSENDVKKAISNRARRQELEALHQDVDAINSMRREHRDLRTSGDDEAPLAPVSSGPLELKLIIKADVSGSAEAVRDALHGIGNASASAHVISTGVGEITESDLMMAKAANATIIGFSVTASRSIKNNATQNGIPVYTSDIIYRLVDDVRERVTALLPVVLETKVTGEATILQLFDINLKQKQTMKIAGCRVTNGVVEKQKFIRILRNGNIVYDGTLTTMRQLKKDITEARKGTECGLGFGEFNDLEAGDLIQTYEKIERPGVI